eukprot:TRINITY_DN8310_c0_g1_i1.p1 TRINITY_DN8310_c0_g1~~TRINITY_DN8310_c0_g1_i1.p1  ORF type:complete len:602 (+),score=157.21 TRINITY_DN8310_c0_g1_i1:263-1807(+)
MNTLREQLVSAKNSISESQKIRRDLENQKQDISKKIELERTRSDKLDSQIKAVQVEQDTLLKSNQKLRGEIDELSPKVNILPDFEAQVRRLNFDEQTFSQTLAEKTRLVDTLSLDKDLLKKDLETLRIETEIPRDNKAKEIDEKYRELFSTKIVELNTRYRDQLEDEIERKKAEYSLKRETLFSAQAEISSRERLLLENELYTLTERYNQEKKRSDALKNENFGLNKQLEKLIPDLQELEATKIRLDNEKIALMAQCKKEEDEISVLNKNLLREKNELVNEISKARLELKLFKAEKEKNENEFNDLKKQLEMLEGMRNESQDRVLILEKKTQEIEKKSRTMSSRNESLQNEIDKFRSLLEGAEQNIGIEYNARKKVKHQFKTEGPSYTYTSTTASSSSTTSINHAPSFSSGGSTFDSVSDFGSTAFGANTTFGSAPSFGASSTFNSGSFGFGSSSTGSSDFLTDKPKVEPSSPHSGAISMSPLQETPTMTPAFQRHQGASPSTEQARESNCPVQ